MLSRPAEAPPPLDRLSDSEPVRKFQEEFTTRSGADRPRDIDPWRVSLRRLVGRISGRANRRRVLVLAAATEALVARCDALADRLSALESLTGEITDTFGAELAHLRAEVAHLRTQATSLEDRRGE